MMADHEQMLVGVKFLMGTDGNLAHGHGQAADNVRRGNLPRLAHVDEAGLVRRQQGRCLDGGEFEFKHGFSLRLDVPLAWILETRPKEKGRSRRIGETGPSFGLRRLLDAEEVAHQMDLFVGRVVEVAQAEAGF